MFNVLLSFLLFIQTSLSKKNINKLLLQDVEVINLPSSYVTDGQIDAETGNTLYFEINQCAESTANSKYASLNIIVPDNPSLSNTQGYPVIELSKCKNNWDPTNCFIGSNYLWSSHPTLFNHISWIFQEQPEDIYGRIRSYNRDVSISLLLTYNNDSGISVGNFTSGVIPGLTASANSVYSALLQYVKSQKESTVTNLDSQVFFFSICSRYHPYNTDYSINVNVVGDVSSPLSAFDLIGCAYSNTPDYNDCTTANLDAETDQDASALVSIQMKNDENIDLTQGVWLVVTGQGGNINLQNVFTIDVSIVTSS